MMTGTRTPPPGTQKQSIPSTGGDLGPGRMIALLIAAASLSVVASMIATAGGETAATAPADVADTEPVADTGPVDPRTPPPADGDGEAAGGYAPGDTIPVSMIEFSYGPTQLELPAGRYTFAITNDGAAPHEWALSAVGDHGHHFAQTRQLAAGASQELEVTLEPGVYEYACHVPGHYEAGMKGTITVTS